jgi:hydrogenase expression/formation protein HypC
MCLGVPGRVTEVFERGGMPMATVEMAGVARTVCLSYAPEARPGQYVVVHVGFAVSVMDEREAERSLALFAEMERAGEPVGGALDVDGAGTAGDRP